MKSVLLVIFAVVAVAAASFWAFDLSHANTLQFPGIMAVPYVLLLGIAFYIGRRDDVLGTWLRPRWGDISIGVLVGILTFLGAWAFVHIVAPQGSPRESWVARAYLQIGLPGMLRAQTPLVTITILFFSIAEEVVWRGLVPHLLEGRFGTRRAWLIASVGYAVAYLPTAYALRDPVSGWNPLIVLGAFGASLIWGGLARAKESLVPNILAHTAFVWIATMLFRLWGPGL